MLTLARSRQRACATESTPEYPPSRASLILCVMKQERAMMNTRPATREDIPFLLALRQQTMDAHLLASGVDTSGEYHLERVTYRFDCALILMDQGLPVGLLKVDRGPNEWEILQIQLASEMQGAGGTPDSGRCNQRGHRGESRPQTRRTESQSCKASLCQAGIRGGRRDRARIHHDAWGRTCLSAMRAAKPPGRSGACVLIRMPASHRPSAL